MKTFNTCAAQGDVMFSKALQIPEGAKSIQPVNGNIVITHSETGHDHIMELDKDCDIPNVEMFSIDDNPLISWIKVNRPTSLKHMRSFDTHEPILFLPGTYEVRRQREYTPQGFRRVED